MSDFRSKVEYFQGHYETVHQAGAEKKGPANKDVVPGTGRFMDKEDKDGNQLWRVILFNHGIDTFIEGMRKHGFVAKRFIYDEQSYKEGQQKKLALEQKF